jgi:hypothetical protein
MVFRVLPIYHAFCLLIPLVFVLILAAKTLVTLSVKDREKDTPQIEMDPSASKTSLAFMLGEPGMKLCLPLCFWCFDLVPSSCWRCERIQANDMIANLFADFERTLEDLGADDLMKIVRAYLSRGIVACQKGFEKASAEAKTPLDKQKFLEDEN